jgi:hypothetical protein
MGSLQATHRRDSRYPFSRGKTSIDLGSTSSGTAEIANVSVAGLAMITKRDEEIAVGQGYPDAVLHIGPCTVRGEIMVTNVNPSGRAAQVYGCLFYPATLADTERWMIVLSSAEAMVGS